MFAIVQAISSRHFPAGKAPASGKRIWLGMAGLQNSPILQEATKSFVVTMHVPVGYQSLEECQTRLISPLRTPFHPRLTPPFSRNFPYFAIIVPHFFPFPGRNRNPPSPPLPLGLFPLPLGRWHHARAALLNQVTTLLWSEGCFMGLDHRSLLFVGIWYARAL